MALRRYRGGTNAIGRAFYKGGFEPRMNRKEAALVLQTRFEEFVFKKPIFFANVLRRTLLSCGTGFSFNDALTLRMGLLYV